MKSLGKIIIVIVTILISFLIAVQVVLHETTKAVTAMAQGISQEFKAAFNAAPTITVNHRVVASESHPLAELATASKSMSVDTTFVSTWLYSTKTISVQGRFVAKAGFDLDQLFKINLQTHPRQMTVTLPNPRILSVEMTANEITDQKGGVVNWLQPQDHEAALQQLTAEAKREFENSSLKAAAKVEMEKRIRALAALKDVPVQIQYEAGQLRPEKPED